MIKERVQLIVITRFFRYKPAPEVIREAIDLFLKYLNATHHSDIHWRYTIPFADGERREIATEQDFFFHYQEQKIQPYIYVSLPTEETLSFFYTVDTACVIIKMPVRENIENVFRVFSISEEYDTSQENSIDCLSSKAKMIQRDIVLSQELVKNTRSYIEKAVTQINETYTHACYDACAVMIRRLIETLIIEVFEHYKIANEIQNSAGEFYYLKELIPIITNNKSWNLSRNTKSALPKLKKSEIFLHIIGILMLTIMILIK